MNLDGKRILVTGGTGSLGQTLVRRLLAGGKHGHPSRVTVFSRDEAKQHYMRLSYLNREVATDEVIYRNFKELLHFRIGDMRDAASVRDAVRQADVIIHAAALKQVPTCEYFPYQAVMTNITGAQNLVRAAKERDSGVELVVGVSTDKACKPINVMGMTKALMERILVEANLESRSARFACVRYGNVVASRGSVVPLFLDQIRNGGPVTVTLPEMTRFLLTLERAVDAVLAAVSSALPGETYVPQMPAARVVDIAETLIAGRDIRIDMTGIRPGEKVHEIIVSAEESYRTIERDGYFVIRPMLQELISEQAQEPALKEEYSSASTCLGKAELGRLLDTYRSNIEEAAA